MSDDYDVGYARPPKHTRFKPGVCPNRNGRPRKKRRALVPSQVRKDLLEALDQVVQIKTAKGIEKLTMLQLILRALINKAAKGNGPCIKLCLQLLGEKLQERCRTYPSVNLIEILMPIIDDPQLDPGQLERDTLDDLLRRTRRSY